MEYGHSALLEIGKRAAAHGGVFTCPSFPDKEQGNEDKVRFDLFPTTAGKVSSLAVVDSPSSKIMILEAGKNGTVSAADWS